MYLSWVQYYRLLTNPKNKSHITKDEFFSLFFFNIKYINFTYRYDFHAMWAGFLDKICLFLFLFSYMCVVFEVFLCLRDLMFSFSLSVFIFFLLFYKSRQAHWQSHRRRLLFVSNNKINLTKMEKKRKSNNKNDNDKRIEERKINIFCILISVERSRKKKEKKERDFFLVEEEKNIIGGREYDTKHTHIHKIQKTWLNDDEFLIIVYYSWTTTTRTKINEQSLSFILSIILFFFLMKISRAFLFLLNKLFQVNLLLLFSFSRTQAPLYPTQQQRNNSSLLFIYFFSLSF